MSNKKSIIAAVDKLNALSSQSPIVKGLIDGGLSLIPFLGSAITSALDTRSFQIFEHNSRQFALEVKSLVDKLDESKIDKGFLNSDEFVSLLTEILARNARTYEHEKIKLFAIIFVNATTFGKSGIPFKEGFIRIIDELSPTHILALSVIYKKSLNLPKNDKRNYQDCVTTSAIADEIGVSTNRVQAYCEQMIRFGLLRDHGIGFLDYKPGMYEMTDYGYEFAEFLRTETYSIP